MTRNPVTVIGAYHKTPRNERPVPVISRYRSAAALTPRPPTEVGPAARTAGGWRACRPRRTISRAPTLPLSAARDAPNTRHLEGHRPGRPRRHAAPPRAQARRTQPDQPASPGLRYRARSAPSHGTSLPPQRTRTRRAGWGTGARRPGRTSPGDPRGAALLRTSRDLRRGGARPAAEAWLARVRRQRSRAGRGHRRPLQRPGPPRRRL